MRQNPTTHPTTQPSNQVSWHFAALVSLLFVYLPARDAHAYLDPATSTMIIQAFGAAIAGMLFTIKMNWLRVKSFFRRDSAEIEKAADPAAQSGERTQS
ncbi:MAG: hypothetical protein JRH19_27865 [Deltaproteobacteria bacterium]|nr:hypothetical protein [Deltaproteobacteria bacterium]